ncbi:oxidoreductase, short chain dehydrogenase/reductase family [Metarhizium album ARSEF 1941]|uniref:Oxidoreductase, short chain dehydrogenase/reductase family n=1 Tax=Metarhizium album (strain ARSEF 1941) TaxID=1081103 RepID=A0A0B2X2A3_METAS|nr:oxidoreductase, short chain dehydrogenase/reductase family [Metarhizium album ARSEF 1941]KHN99355.1 oxidoreductase, short chain dehydrogenase/reductase family [Metarhizium album ARSEF 1941]
MVPRRFASTAQQAAALLGSVDVLVCLAGIVGCAHALERPVSQFRRILDVNAAGSFICARAAARQMVRQGRGGRIVLSASVSAHRAAEWARYGITVNSVSPGRTWCERNPLGRMGSPDEVAGVVVMLASNAGSYMNGADVICDGGGVVF